MLGDEKFNRSFTWLKQVFCSAFATFVAVSETFLLEFLVACDIFDLALDFVIVKVSDISVFVEDLFVISQQSVENKSLS